MGFQMRDGAERVDFLSWAKDLFRHEEFQQRRQEEDFREGGLRKLKKGKHSRWNRELQRRLGTPSIWHMVVFTGRLDATFLQEAVDSGSAQTANLPAPTPDLTQAAKKAREALSVC